jgi:prepilin-type processing-associated H-X9-DG protein
MRRPSPPRPDRRRGATRAEVVVAVSILLLAALLVLGGALRWQRQAARAAACRGQLGRLGTALALYRSDAHWGAWPDRGRALLDERYLPQATAFHCPGAAEHHPAGDYLRQADWGGAGVNPAVIQAGDDGYFRQHPAATNFLFQDGHVEVAPPDEPRLPTGLGEADHPFEADETPGDILLETRILD